MLFRSQSSTDIRELHSLDVPKMVIDYIIEHELYFVKKIKSYLTIKRYLHSVSVANLAYEIAKSNNQKDCSRYFIAGILHDIGKYIAKEQENKIMEEHFPQYKDFPSPVIHQFTGSYLAETVFGTSDKEIIEAIEFHTTGHPGLSRLAKVIYASDKIEPTRGFDSTELIEAMKVNIEKGFITVLSANKDYYIEHNVPYDNFLTKATMDEFLK